MLALRAAAASIAYATCGLAFGMLFGIFRVTLLVPAFGEIPAVIAEVPLMLAIGMAAANAVVRHVLDSDNVQARLATGILAFALMQAGESAIVGMGGPDIFRRSMEHYGQGTLTLFRLIGLAAQGLWGLLPLFALSRRSYE